MENKYTEIPDPRWKDLYRIGFIFSILSAAAIVATIIIFAVVGFAPGTSSVEEIFKLIQSNKLKGLLSIEIQLIITQLIMMPLVPAMYAALKQVNESYALLALITGIIGIVLLFTARPVVEMVYLSDKYTAAAGEAEKNLYLAAGEDLNALFNGTAWMLWNILSSISLIINSVLMLKSRIFKRSTGITGFIICIPGILFFLPVIGPVLSLIATFGAIAFYIFLAYDFYKFGAKK